jgi:hypothetical protein
MVQFNRHKAKSLIASTVAGVVSLLSLSSSASAAMPLETLIRSTAGRVILSEVHTGPAAVARVTGTPVEAALRQAKLIEALSDPRMTAAAEDISTRLNRVEARFREKFPNSADEVFAQSGRALSAAERACLLRIAGEELDPAFVEFLPTRPAGALKTYASSREAFLTEQILKKAPEAAVEKLARWKATNFSDRALNVRVFDIYQQMASVAQVKQILSPLAVQELLAESASAPLIRNLEKVLNTDTGATSLGSVRADLIAALKSNLTGKVPAASVKGRVDNLLKDPSSLKSLKRALGELTLAETQHMFHGGNPLAPTAESWLGQYISETGAATVVRQFQKVPGRPELSESRLVVSVDANTITKWSSLFGNEHFFGQLHTPRQGTLMVTFNNSTASWSGANPANVMRAASEGTFIPAMILSSTEGGRMERYFTYGKDWTSFQRVRNPWENAEYCARGAYGSCTHWFGNIPIGDRLVTEYKLPGWVDFDPYTQPALRGPQDPSPRIETLNPYANAEADEGLREVLRYPGHEQLSEVMGLMPQQLGAELSNPGWVAVSVLGHAPVSRVPVVFRFTADARAPIDPNFDLQIDAH